MFPLLKRIAFVASIPVLLAIGGWAQWSIFMTDPAPVDGTAADIPRVEIARTGEEPIPAEPRTKPARSSDRPAAIDAAERAQPPAPGPEVDTDFAQGYAAPPEARIEPVAAPALASVENSANAAAAEQKPPRDRTQDTKARQAALPATQDNQSAAEQEREIRRTQDEAAEARKAVAAKREKAEQDKQQGSGRPSLASRDRSFPGPDGISRRDVRALISELRSRMEDMPPRFGRLGRPPWAR
jgi:hypothetical protein